MKTLFQTLLLTLILTVASYAQERVSASVLYSNVQAANQIRPGVTVGLGFAIYNGERVLLELVADTGYNFDTKRAMDLQNIFGGFRVSVKAGERLTPFAHAMYGATKNKYINSTLRFTPYPASAFGAGLDVRVSDRLSFRVIQIDAVHVDRISPRFAMRYGSGIVVHLF